MVKKKESEVTQWCLTLCDPHGLVAYQAPASMGFSRQEYWSGLPFPSPGDLLDPGIEPRSQHCRQTLYHLSQQGRLPVVNYFANLNIHLKFWSMFIKPDSQTEITHVRNNYPGDFWFQTLKAKINNSMEEIEPVSLQGNQPWTLFGRTDAEAEAPILWPSDSNSWLTGKDLEAGKDWRQRRRGPQRMRRLDGFTHSMGMNLGTFQMVKGRET